MKTLILALSLFSINFSSNAQNFYLPDDNFEQALIDLGYDSGPLDDSAAIVDVNTLTTLDVSSKSIADLTGLKYFIALEELNCSFNQLNGIDLYYNVALTSLNCFFNPIYNLDLSTNNALIELTCGFSPLTYLNLTANPNLIKLDAGGSEIAVLDISQCTALEYLDLFGAPIVNLDVTPLINLKKALLTGTIIETIDLTQCTELTLLDISIAVNELDVTQNLLLDTLKVHGSMDTINLTQNTALTYLSFRSANISGLDLSQNTNLVTLISGGDQLKILDLSQNPNLEKIDLGVGGLEKLNIKNGNNSNINFFRTEFNPDLTCVEVDNVAYSNTNWTNKDAQTYYSENCSLGTETETPIKFEVSPNPVNAILNLSVDMQTTYNLTSLSGQHIFNGILYPGKNQLNIENLNAGIYFISIENRRYKKH